MFDLGRFISRRNPWRTWAREIGCRLRAEYRGRTVTYKIPRFTETTVKVRIDRPPATKANGGIRGSRASRWK